MSVSQADMDLIFLKVVCSDVVLKGMSELGTLKFPAEKQFLGRVCTVHTKKEAHSIPSWAIINSVTNFHIHHTAACISD